jgi:hypothetical protein
MIALRALLFLFTCELFFCVVCFVKLLTFVCCFVKLSIFGFVFAYSFALMCFVLHWSIHHPCFVNSLLLFVVLLM